MQRSVEARKRFVWPLYVAALHAKLECPVWLVVVTHDQRVARWASEPIATFQPGSSFVPIVVGPDRIPRVGSEEEAKRFKVPAPGASGKPAPHANLQVDIRSDAKCPILGEKPDAPGVADVSRPKLLIPEVLGDDHLRAGLARGRRDVPGLRVVLYGAAERPPS